MPRFDKRPPDSTPASPAGRPAPILRRLSLLGAVLLLALLLVPMSVRADNKNVAKGKQLFASKRCADCHGANGRKPFLPAYPVIAGQSADYLYAALAAYKTGARTGHGAGAHHEMFQSLTYADLQRLADYIATLK